MIFNCFNRYLCNNYYIIMEGYKHNYIRIHYSEYLKSYPYQIRDRILSILLNNNLRTARFEFDIKTKLRFIDFLYTMMYSQYNYGFHKIVLSKYISSKDIVKSICSFNKSYFLERQDLNQYWYELLYSCFNEMCKDYFIHIKTMYELFIRKFCLSEQRQSELISMYSKLYSVINNSFHSKYILRDYKKYNFCFICKENIKSSDIIFGCECQRKKCCYLLENTCPCGHHNSWTYLKL